MYYKQQTVTPKNVEFRFVLVRELPLEIQVSNHGMFVKKSFLNVTQVVEKEYRDWKRDGEFRLCLKENAIKLVLTKQEVDTWEIVELTKPQVLQGKLLKCKIFFKINCIDHQRRCYRIQERWNNSILCI